MVKRVKDIFGWLLIALFVSYYSGATLFPHTHSYTWGTVTHSHPYLPSAHHTHSSTALQAIHIITSFVFALSAVSLVVALYATEFTLGSTCKTEADNLFKIHYNLRAPPIFC